MIKYLHEIVEDAIARKLHVYHPTEVAPLGRPKVMHPVRLEPGQVVLRDSDCGGRDVFWSLETWRNAAGSRGENLLRKVGIWEFVQADDPAASDVEWASQDPRRAGEMLYTTAAECKLLKTLLRGWLDQHEHGCDCGTDEPGTCIECLSKAALSGHPKEVEQ